MTDEQLEGIIVSIQGINTRMETLQKENELLRLRVSMLEREITSLSGITSRLDDRTRESIRYGLI